MTSLKKWTISGCIFIIVVGSLFHFIYEWTNNNRFIGIFGAVNESTWEHLKMLFWPALIYSIIEYLYIGNKYKNYLFAKAVSFYVGILLIIGIFYTYTGIIGDNYLLLDILTFVIAVIVSQCLGYKIIRSYKYGNQTIAILSFISIIILLFAFVVFTFYPPHIPLFIDPLNHTYGI